MRLRGIVVCIFVFLSAAAFAQAPNPLLEATRQARDLEFPAKVSEFSAFSSPGMAVYKPEGPGPFPAIVLFHQCGGLRDRSWQNASMLEWARIAVAHGYVALLIDALGPRNAGSVCMGAQGGVTFVRGARDAFQAAAHLRKFDFVDKRRVALSGYSWGAMVGALAAAKGFREGLSPDEGFNALVSFYPGCFQIRPPNGGTPYDIVRSDIDRPLLVLMGADDTETPAMQCEARLGIAKFAGAPVQWHIYPETTHCWDCKNLDGFRKTDVRGTQVTYRYSAANTKDAERRMFEFLDAAMPPGG